jgi:acyl-CoA thioester hydrolase
MSLRDASVRLSLQSYPLRYRHRLLFSDVDAFQHLNNSAPSRFFEEGRAEANRSIFGHRTASEGAVEQMLVNLTADYLKKARYPGDVDVCTAIWKAGTSSVVYAQAAFQEGVCFALAEAVMVKVVDGRPTPLSEHERGVIARLGIMA